MEGRLDSKIKELTKMARLYEELIKKDYNYQYRLDAIYDQLEILIELKDNKNDIVENWQMCYKEDVRNI